jgi:hypothetical protein
MGEQVSESELPSELTLTVGEHRTLPLRSLAMAGYRWSGSVSDPAVVVLEIKRGEVTPGPRAGVSAPEEAVLRGAQPGDGAPRAPAVLGARPAASPRGRATSFGEIAGRRPALRTLIAPGLRA